MFCAFSLLLSEAYVQCKIWQFRVGSYVMLSRYFLNDFEMVPVAPTLLISLLFFAFHTCSVSAVRSLCFKIFSAYFFVTFISSEITVCINVSVPSSLSRIMTFGSLLGMFLHLLLSQYGYLTFITFYINFGTLSYRYSLSNFSPISLQMLKWIGA